ncbi:MAG: DUF6161 domain-containing protein, partial [Caulobacteraceae bacterium]
FWQFINDEVNRSPHAGRSQPLLDAWARHNSRLSNIAELLSNNIAADVHQNLLGVFLSSDGLPFSKSIQGSLVSQVRMEFGDRVALGAVAALLSLKFDGDDPALVRGVYTAHELLSSTGRAARQSVQTGLANLLKRLSGEQLRAEEKADALDRRMEKLERDRRRNFERMLKAGQQARQRLGNQLLAVSAEAIQSIKNTEAVYTEHMALKGPVTYWRDKAGSHRKNSNIARFVGLGFAAVIIIYAYWDGFQRVLNLVEEAVVKTKQWQAGYVVLTFAVLMVTIIFWIGRLISRTYVSEAHLAIDADERATMVQTYLALANENKISDAERTLVLAALFRPSSDGLVRDDTVPDLSLAGIVSKVSMGK